MSHCASKPIEKRQFSERFASLRKRNAGEPSQRLWDEAVAAAQDQSNSDYREFHQSLTKTIDLGAAAVAATAQHVAGRRLAAGYFVCRLGPAMLTSYEAAATGVSRFLSDTFSHS